MTTGTDPIVALAEELGHLGRRLDGIGAELRSIAGQRGTVGPDLPAGAGVPSGADVPESAARPEPPQTWPPQGSPAPAGYGAVPPGPGAPGRFPPPGWSGPPVQGAQPGLVQPGMSQPGMSQPGMSQPGMSQPGMPQPGMPFPGAGPQPGGQGPWQPPAGMATWPAPAPRRGVSALSGARILAWTGGAVTLLGVVLLLVLAASRGWFSPEARVGAGAVLGVALIGLGWWLHRRESARTGALALAATGFGTLYLVVAGATFVLHLPEIPAVLLGLVVAAGGLGLADRWRSALLAGGVVVGAAFLAPWLVEGTLLVALLLALQVAAAPVALRRGWVWVAALATVGPVLHGYILAVQEDDHAVLTASVLAVAVVGLAMAAFAVTRLPDGAVAGLLAAVPFPAIAAGGVIGDWGGAALAAAAGLLALALVAVPGAGRVTRVTACSVGAIALFTATTVALDGTTWASVLLGEAVVLAVWAAAARRRGPLIAAAPFAAVGVLAALVHHLVALVEFPAEPYVVAGVGRPAAMVEGAVVSLLVLAVAVAGLVASGRVGLARPDARTSVVWAPLGAVGLYGAAGLVVALTLLVAPTRTGFTAGHAIVTVSWTIVALVLLARGIRRPALRVTGLVLVGAAVAKLVLFDLTALDGIARVAAFLGAGLVLLAAGTRYARLVAEAESAAAGTAAVPEQPHS